MIFNMHTTASTQSPILKLKQSCLHTKSWFSYAANDVHIALFCLSVCPSIWFLCPCYRMVRGHIALVMSIRPYVGTYVPIWSSSYDQFSPVCCNFCFPLWNLFIFGSCLPNIIQLYPAQILHPSWSPRSWSFTFIFDSVVATKFLLTAITSVSFLWIFFHIWLMSSYHHPASFCTRCSTPAQPQGQGCSLIWLYLGFSSCDQVSPVCCNFCFSTWNPFIFGSCLLIIILPQPRLSPKVKSIPLYMYDSFPFIKWSLTFFGCQQGQFVCR